MRGVNLGDFAFSNGEGRGTLTPFSNSVSPPSRRASTSCRMRSSSVSSGAAARRERRGLYKGKGGWGSDQLAAVNNGTSPLWLLEELGNQSCLMRGT